MCTKPCYRSIKIQGLEHVVEGILFGLTLATLLGPIFVVLIDTSMRYGARAGLAVGSGIWVSDVLFILFSYYFIHQIQHYIEDSTFQYWVGNLGGFILITIGIANFLKKPKIDNVNITPHYLRNAGFFGKGFIINTFNPFTFVFWFGVIGSRFIESGHQSYMVLITCVTILVVIVVTDASKVLGAKWISKKIQPGILSKINKLAGILLVIGGIVLIGKTRY